MLKECSLLDPLAFFLFHIFQLKVQYFLHNATKYFLYFSATSMTPGFMSCACPNSSRGAKGSLRRTEQRAGLGLAGSCWGWPEAVQQEPNATFKSQDQRSDLMEPNLFSGNGGDVDLGTGATRSPKGFKQVPDTHDKHLSSTRKAWFRKFIGNHPC